MSEQDIKRLVKSIADNESATLTLTDSQGKRTSHRCIFKESEAPHFFIVLSSNESLPPDIDFSRSCAFVSKNKEGETVSFSTSVVERKNKKIIELTAKKSINPEDLREYFRVNLKTSITVSFQPENPDIKLAEWEITGEVVDISQSGVLAILSEECKVSNSLFIEIDLTEPVKTVYCIGHIVRKQRIRKNRWLTAFHFDEISQKTVDDIARNCFAEQRRQLRENIQTTG
jgi:c-di-GMP-binding flagellar brake protein YcgR